MVLTLVIVTDEAAQYDADPGGQPGGPGAPVPGARGDHPAAGGRVPAGRGDPGRRVRRRARRSCCACTAARRARRLGGHAAAGAGHPGGDLVAGRGARTIPARTRSARSRSAGSPTRPPPRRRTTALASLAAHYQPGRHRPGLDPGHARGARCSPPPWTSRTRPISGGEVAAEAGQPERGPDRRLAVACGWGSRSRTGSSGGPGITAVMLRHQRRARSRSPAPTAGPPRCLAGRAGPQGGAAPPGHRRTAGRGTAPARP